MLQIDQNMRSSKSCT